MTEKDKTAVVLDFDGTVAMTFEPIPNGFGVEGAYEVAVERLFGVSGIEMYRQKGGLRNRSPREVILELQKPNDDTATLTEKLVQIKISSLTAQIGQRLPDGAMWPRLAQGFDTFWKRSRVDKTIFTAILSSGHQAFIRKTFEVHGLELPDLVVSDDELRRLPEPLSKPDPRLWSFMLGQARNLAFVRSVYIGDDRNKDGTLAHNVNVPFWHFAPIGTEGHGQSGSFADWTTFNPFP